MQSALRPAKPVAKPPPEGDALAFDLSLAEHMVRRYAFSVLKERAPWLCSTKGGGLN